MKENMMDKFQTVKRLKPANMPQNLAWQVSSQQEVSYQVSLNRGLLDATNATFANSCGANGREIARRLVVIDSKVATLYKDSFDAYFTAWNITPIWKEISGDEAHKTIEQVLEVTDAMSDAGLLRRTEAVIAVGGGVVLDIVGLAASMYRRGIPYLRIPTTLMGQIDAGIGIKTGINRGYHKNRVGTYFAPVSALIDPGFLKTVDQRHIANGVSEIIKMALIKDKALFQLLEKEAGQLTAERFAYNTANINEIFSRAIAGMLEELEPNLWEAELERSVDYGHTFSPSLELRADPELLHGEAVAVDMALSVSLALHRYLITESEAQRALNLIVQTGLPILDDCFSVDLLETALDDTIKHRDGFQRVPLTAGLGEVTFVNDLTRAELEIALDYVRQFQNRLSQLERHVA